MQNVIIFRAFKKESKKESKNGSKSWSKSAKNVSKKRQNSSKNVLKNASKSALETASKIDQKSHLKLTPSPEAKCCTSELVSTAQFRPMSANVVFPRVVGSQIN